MSSKRQTRKPKVKPKGICCIEASWSGKLDRPMSVRPALELLGQWEPFNIPFAHRDVVTRAEFDAYLVKWCQAGNQAKFPILYLATHGDSEALYIGDGRKRENQVTLDELGETLAGKCKKRLIHFGGCGIVDVNGHRLNRFLRSTGALAVSGYRSDVLWLDSMAFELMVFGAMQLNALTRSGAAAMKRRIERTTGSMAKDLGFRMVVSR